VCRLYTYLEVTGIPGRGRPWPQNWPKKEKKRRRIRRKNKRIGCSVE